MRVHPLGEARVVELAAPLPLAAHHLDDLPLSRDARPAAGRPDPAAISFGPTSIASLRFPASMLRSLQPDRKGQLQGRAKRAGSVYSGRSLRRLVEPTQPRYTESGIARK